MDETRVVSVEINGQRYPIRSHLDAAYIAELAAFSVTDELAEVRRQLALDSR